MSTDVANNSRKGGKGAVTGQGANAATASFYAIIALQKPTSVKTREVASALRRTTSGVPLAIETHGRDDLELTLLTVNKVQLAILNIATPAPAEAFGGAANANMPWPAAPHDLATHHAHIFAVPEREKGESRHELLAHATIVTLVTAAVAPMLREMKSATVLTDATTQVAR